MSLKAIAMNMKGIKITSSVRNSEKSEAPRLIAVTTKDGKVISLLKKQKVTKFQNLIENEVMEMM